MPIGAPETHAFEYPYSKLVIGVGSECNDYGIPGVRDNSYFLKVKFHVFKIRNRSHVGSFFVLMNPRLSGIEGRAENQGAVD